MALRRHLIILAALAILPLLLFITWIVIGLHREERARAERSLTSTARALSLAADGEIGAIAAALQSLATSRDLANGNLRAFYAQAASLKARQEGWATITLADRTGAPLLDLLHPFGPAPPGRGDEREDVEAVVVAGAPAVSEAFRESPAGPWLIAVRVPVVREKSVRAVLSAHVATRELREVLLGQRLPPEWIGTLLDRRRVIIARTRGEEQFVGQLASNPLLQASARASEGWYRGLTKEGTATYSAFSRSGATGITVALGVPAEIIDAPLGRTLWSLAGAGALALGVGVVIAIVFARRIAGPITALAVAARDLGRGTAPPPAISAITEVNTLRQAMREAAAQVVEEKATRETINRTGQLLAGELGLDRLVQGVTDACMRLSHAAFGAFFHNVADPRGETYTLYAISGAPREAFADFHPTFRGEAVVRIDDVTAIPATATTPPYPGMPAGHLPVRSYLAVAVVARSGEVLGGLFFGHPEPGVFTDREAAIVPGLAPQIATAIDNARLYERQQAARAEAEAANR